MIGQTALSVLNDIRKRLGRGGERRRRRRTSPQAWGSCRCLPAMKRTPAVRSPSAPEDGWFGITRLEGDAGEEVTAS